MLEQLIAGDVAAEAAAEPLLVNPDRAELQAELDPLKADINEQNVRKAAVEEINRSVRAKDESAEALTRRGDQVYQIHLHRFFEVGTLWSRECDDFGEAAGSTDFD